jgi:xanthine dehydrogenase accessory factor
MTTQALPSWPVFGLADDVRSALGRAVARGQAVALATIVGLESGGPRPLGAQMSIAADEVCGFLSGGCVEADVVGHAHEALADGRPRRLVYGAGSPWPDIRLLCGARMEILVEPLAPGHPALLALLDLTTRRTPAVWVSDGVRRRCVAAADAPAPWRGAFVRTFDPVTRLVVVGSDPTALAIATLGAQAGLETTLVRPKGPQEPPPIPGVGYRREAPAAALAAIGLDPWTAVAVASHDAELDHEALVAALPSRAFYVGALGARRRLEDRRAALRDAGLAAQAIGRLHAPIGLDIGGKAPFEVAVAVLAEITALRHRPAPPAEPDQSSRPSARTSTTSSASAAFAIAGRRTRASASANTVTSEES